MVNIPPRKLIRNKIADKIIDSEIVVIKDQKELNELYFFKILEELQEIQLSDYRDVSEFGDLMQVVFSFARINGFSKAALLDTIFKKSEECGIHKNQVLILNETFNKTNPSNKMYFDLANDNVLMNIYNELIHPVERNIIDKVIGFNALNKIIDLNESWLGKENIIDLKLQLRTKFEENKTI